MSAVVEPSAVRTLLLELCRELRAAGLPGSVDRTATFLRAVDLLGVSRDGVRSAALAALVDRPEQHAVVDAVLAGFWPGSASAAPSAPPSGEGSAAPEPPSGTGGGTREGTGDTAGGARPDAGPEPVIRADDPDTPAGVLASRRELLRRSDFATEAARLPDPLLRELDRLVVADPLRRGRRHRPGRTLPDRRATTRAIVAAAGEPVRLRHRRHRPAPRRVLVVLDVSGSMRPWLPGLLAVAHRLVQRLRRVEVFTAGTRLTRVTVPLRRPHRESALAAVDRLVPDLGGGTRIGDTLGELLRTWGRRGAARGAVVVIVSDGWERPPLEPLAAAVAGLSRLAHRVVWVTPQLGRDGYRPVQAGMLAVQQHVDHLVAGHSVAAVEELLGVIARA